MCWAFCQVTLQLWTSSTVEELLKSVRDAVGCSKGRLLFRMRPLQDPKVTWRDVRMRDMSHGGFCGIFSLRMFWYSFYSTSNVQVVEPLRCH